MQARSRSRPGGGKCRHFLAATSWYLPDTCFSAHLKTLFCVPLSHVTEHWKRNTAGARENRIFRGAGSQKPPVPLAPERAGGGSGAGRVFPRGREAQTGAPGTPQRVSEHPLLTASALWGAAVALRCWLSEVLLGFADTSTSVVTHARAGSL